MRRSVKKDDKQTRLKISHQSTSWFNARMQSNIHGGMDMSLSINDNLETGRSVSEADFPASHPDIERLDKYLALIESNKKSCQFVPTDALLAMDMAAHAISRLSEKAAAGLSISRLAHG